MQKITKEMLAAAMQCKTAGELVEQAKSKGYDITQEQAEAYLEQFSSYELTDKELEDISGSGFGEGEFRFRKWIQKCSNYQDPCKKLIVH